MFHSEVKIITFRKLAKSLGIEEFPRSRADVGTTPFFHTRGTTDPIQGISIVVSHGARYFDFHETRRLEQLFTATREVYIYIYFFLSLYFSPTRTAKEGEEGIAFPRLESGPWIHSVGFCATRRFSNPLLLFLQSPSPPLFLRQASQPVIDST